MNKLTVEEICMDTLNGKIFDFNNLLYNDHLTDEAIDACANKIHWNFGMCGRIKCAEWVLEKHIDKINWLGLSYNGEIKFSSEFIKKHGDKFNFKGNFIKNHPYLVNYGHLDLLLKNDISWEKICFYQDMSEEFIRKHINEIDWINIIVRNKLSIEFIEEFINELDFDLLSQYQDLPEWFIEKYKNELNWELISKYQDLSKKFIIKHRNKIVFNEKLNTRLRRIKGYRFYPNNCISEWLEND